MTFERRSIIALIAFCIAVGALGAVILLPAPFWLPGDVFSYLGWSQSIVDTHHINLLGRSNITPALYSFFPLTFLLVAVGSMATGLSVPVVTVILNILFIVAMPAAYYLASLSLFRDHRIAFITAVLGTTIGNAFAAVQAPNESFPLFSTSQVSLFFFLLALALFAMMIRERPKYSWHLALPLWSLIITTILSHPQSAVLRGTFFTFAAFIFFISAKQGHHTFFLKLTFWTAFPWFVVFLVNIGNLPIIFGIGEGVAVHNNLGLLSSSAFHLTDQFGEVLSGLLVIFVVLLMRKRIKVSSFSYGILLIFTALCILGTFQTVIGLSFFPGRYLSELGLPIILVASVALIKFLDAIRPRKYLRLIMATGIFIASIFPYAQTISRAGFNFDWPMIRAMQWSKDRFHNQRVLADPYLLYTFQGFTGLIAPYYETRTLKDVTKNPYIEKVFLSDNAKDAYQFLKDERIAYVFFDTASTPEWIGGSFEKFNDTTKYQLVYQAYHHRVTGSLNIYRVL